MNKSDMNITEMLRDPVISAILKADGVDLITFSQFLGLARQKHIRQLSKVRNFQ